MAARQQAGAYINVTLAIIDQDLRTAILDQGIDDLAVLHTLDEDALTAIFMNVRSPGGTIPNPQHAAV